MSHGRRSGSTRRWRRSLGASSSTEREEWRARGTLLGAALLAIGCGGAVVIEGEGGGRQAAASSTGASTSSTGAAGGSGRCVPCKNVFGGSKFVEQTVCPGPHQEALDALVACASRPARCDDKLLCRSPVPTIPLRCDTPTGYVDSPCSSCLVDHCFQEAETCRNLPFG